MTSGIFLSREDLMLLSDSAKDEVLALVTGESISGVYEESEDGLVIFPLFRPKGLFVV